MHPEKITVDLSDTGILAYAIDTVKWAKATIIFTPNGAASSTAIVEVLRSFDPDGLTSESFGTEVILDTSASAPSEINVTDTPFLYIRVNTAEADRLGEVLVLLDDPIHGQYESVLIDLDDTEIETEIQTPLHSVVVKPYPTIAAMSSGSLEIKSYIDPGYPASFVPSINVDSGSLGSIQIVTTAITGLSVSCTGVQSGGRVELFVYQHNEDPRASMAEMRNTVDGGGAPPVAVARGTIIERYTTIRTASIYADVSGSITATIKRTRGATVSTLGTITLTSDTSTRDTHLTSWTDTTLAPGDILDIAWGAGTTLTLATLSLGTEVK